VIYSWPFLYDTLVVFKQNNDCIYHSNFFEHALVLDAIFDRDRSKDLICMELHVVYNPCLNTTYFLYFSLMAISICRYSGLL
jgi:hypothetical protein